MQIPQIVTDQARLMTVNINAEEAITHPDGYEILPLFLDPENGTWVLYARFPPGTRLPKHFHTGSVHFFTTKGSWHYVEHPEDVQTAGSYLYEPGGSVHQFSVPDDETEAAEGFFVVSGANINFSDEGAFMDIMDAGAIEAAVHSVCQMQGRAVPNYVQARSSGATNSA